jgi:hypothetical protein
MTAFKIPAAGLAIYAAVAVALLGGIGVSFAAIVNSAVVSEPPVKVRSPLDARIESAREVRLALAKPLPAPDPLPPITAKVHRPAPKVAARPTTKPSEARAMEGARQVFAKIDSPEPAPAPVFGLLSFGR